MRTGRADSRLSSSTCRLAIVWLFTFPPARRSATTATNPRPAPPDTIANHRATQRLLDAEAKAALRQFVGAKENCEVGTRAALSGAVYRIKLAAPHQPRLARKGHPILARMS